MKGESASKKLITESPNSKTKGGEKGEKLDDSIQDRWDRKLKKKKFGRTDSVEAKRISKRRRRAPKRFPTRV